MCIRDRYYICKKNTLQDNILVIGSSGQIGSELVLELRKEYGDNNVIASDIVPSSEKIINSGPFELLNVTDSEALLKIIKKYKINQVYLLAAILSAKAEKNQKNAWNLNVNSLPVSYTHLTLPTNREV